MLQRLDLFLSSLRSDMDSHQDYRGRCLRTVTRARTAGAAAARGAASVLPGSAVHTAGMRTAGLTACKTPAWGAASPPPRGQSASSIQQHSGVQKVHVVGMQPQVEHTCEAPAGRGQPPPQQRGAQRLRPPAVRQQHLGHPRRRRGVCQRHPGGQQRRRQALVGAARLVGQHGLRGCEPAAAAGGAPQHRQLGQLRAGSCRSVKTGGLTRRAYRPTLGLYLYLSGGLCRATGTAWRPAE